MGTETSRALRARRREAGSQIDRLVAKAEASSPIGAVHRGRIKESARIARRRLRALAAARQSAAAIEIEVGHALLGLVDHGLSHNDAFELVGISRHHGRRFVDLARTPPMRPGADSSTAVPHEPDLVAAPADLDHIGGRPDVVHERRA